MCGDLSPFSASSLKRRRLNVPADELDKCALSQELGEADTHGQNNIYPCRPNISGSVRVRTERGKAADEDAAIKVRRSKSYIGHLHQFRLILVALGWGRA
jgi:hypothetical protein